MHRLASAMVLTSQGIPFLHAGQEFMRTKHGEENSYKSPITTNWLDWERCYEHAADVQFIRELIAIRKRHPAFRLRTKDEVRTHLHVEHTPARSFAFSLRDHAGGDPDQHLYVLYNANAEQVSVTLPALGNWVIRFNDANAQLGADHQLVANTVGIVILAVPGNVD